MPLIASASPLLTPGRGANCRGVLGPPDGAMAPGAYDFARRAYFERLASISPPDLAARYRGVLSAATAEQSDEFFLDNEPRHASMLRTSMARYSGVRPHQSHVCGLAPRSSKSFAVSYA